MAEKRESKLRDMLQRKLITAFDLIYTTNIVYNFIFEHNILSHG